ncbi:hypothetical protein [Robiginitalea marina]|uniref:Uncharacterized protein n=1 Tax=Robiginitalea marina TaxID=2954105 RepID=A0ABT1AUR3_9FLAO|nr:hypothetical protein [Robiginitalea marina]MCO5723345.1 hypothetical protein [Robiginitalea marina]
MKHRNFVKRQEKKNQGKDFPLDDPPLLLPGLEHTQKEQRNGGEKKQQGIEKGWDISLRIEIEQLSKI